jgi:ABC-type uncharacterized transport system fused permease/ATPase subunit
VLSWAVSCTKSSNNGQRSGNDLKLITSEVCSLVHGLVNAILSCLFLS